MNVILCGMPKSGKTTIGKALAERLCFDFVDTDLCIERAYSGSCRQIFTTLGEKAFRELEKQQIAMLKGCSRSVIAIGGGSMNDRENTKILRSLGLIVYLKVSLEVLWGRIQSDGIPAYLDTRDPKRAFETLYKNRVDLYERAADCIIEID